MKNIPKLMKKALCPIVALGVSLLLVNNMSYACVYAHGATQENSYKCFAGKNSSHYAEGTRLCCQKKHGCDTKSDSHCTAY